jgi:hypothetical protein
MGGIIHMNAESAEHKPGARGSGWLRLMTNYT